MIIVEGAVHLEPGEIARLRPAAVRMMQATRAETGCLEYAFTVDLAEPDVLRVIERWADQGALDAHFRTAHMAAFNQALGGAKIKTANIKAYEAKDEGATLVNR